jgi:hypothetical protein
MELNRDDLDAIHDVIFNALDKDVTDSEVVGYWNKFPEEIKLDAKRWGASDTPTRDAIYVWLQKNCN